MTLHIYREFLTRDNHGGQNSHDDHHIIPALNRLNIPYCRLIRITPFVGRCPRRDSARGHIPSQGLSMPLGSLAASYRKEMWVERTAAKRLTQPQTLLGRWKFPEAQVEWNIIT
jgi:hypothetical protein